MKSSALLFLLLYYVSVKAEHPCKEYSECRLDLLSKRFSCMEQPRKAVEQTCKLKDDLRILWKSSLWKEKLMTSCLSQVNSQSSVTFCFHSPSFDMSLLEPCGMALKLLEERCDLLKNCCRISDKCLERVNLDPASKEIKQRRVDAMEKTTTCSRKIYEAIKSKMTEEDIVIARSIVKRTSTIREILGSMTDYPAPVAFAPSPPLAPIYAQKMSTTKKRIQPITVDHEVRRSSPRLTKTQLVSGNNNFLKVHMADYLNETVATKFTPIKERLEKRKAKTLFTQLLHKRKGVMRPWREAHPRSISNIAFPNFPTRFNSSGRVISAYRIPIKEKIWKTKVEEIKPLKVFREVKKTTETTLKPVYLAMRFVDQRTRKGRKKWEWEKMHAFRQFKSSSYKSTSEEDFDAEFEKKAGSLVSFGPNALPLPGSKKYRTVEDPFQDIVEKQVLNTADLSDITTKSPILRPKLKLPSLNPLQYTTPQPDLTTPQALWQPFLSFFSTPAPFYLSTAFPIKIWPFKKAVRGSKTFNNSLTKNEEAINNEELLQPVQSAIFIRNNTSTAVPIIAQPTVEVAKEKGFCLKYQTCLRVLHEAERECENKQKTSAAPKRRREPVCLNLDKKFQITELLKTIESDYRKCIWKDVEGSNKDGEGCLDLPTLPVDYYLFKTCNRKINELRHHCEKASRCCTSADSCHQKTENSPEVADLEIRRRRLEIIMTRCQNKKKIYSNPFNRSKVTPVPKIEGIARIDLK